MNFKDIKGFEGLYQISDTGVVKSLSNSASRKEKILKTYLAAGYPSTELWKEGKKYKQSIHRLVAFAFVDNSNNGTIVNHIDENKLNFHYSNLEWCEPAYNINYSARLRAIEKVIKKYNFTRDDLDILLPALNP